MKPGENNRRADVTAPLGQSARTKRFKTLELRDVTSATKKPELLEDVIAKSRHPLEEGGGPYLSSYLKRKDFARLPDMARLRGNDTQVHP